MKHIYIFYLIIFLCLTGIIYSQENQSEYYLKGMQYLQAGDTAAAENSFYESTKRYSDTPSYYELAKINDNKNTTWGLNKGRQYIEKIIERDPKNIQYRLLYAGMLERAYETNFFDKDGRIRAIAEYKKIIELDSQFVTAYYRLGSIYSEKFLEFNNSLMQEGKNIHYDPYDKSPKNRLKYTIAKMNEQYKPQVDFKDANMEDFDFAKKCLEKCLSLVPGNYEVLGKLVDIYEAVGNYEEGIKLLQNFIINNRNNRDTYLYLGILYYNDSQIEKAYDAFNNAIKMMAPKERNDFMFNSVIEILSPILPDLKNMSYDAIKQLIDNFWKARDPLAMTGFNERLAEHYFRVAYSNLRFSVPDLNLEGWRTERGEMMLRYGMPLSRKKLRPWVNIPEPALTAFTLETFVKTEIWTYPDFTVAFTDKFMNNNFTLSKPEPGINIAQTIIDSDDYTYYKKKQEPESYTPKYEGPAFNTPYYPAQFKNNNAGTDVYINYGIVLNDSIPREEQVNQSYDVGLFYFDKYFNKKFEYRDTINYLYISNDDSTSIHTISVTTEPDSGNLAFEMIREIDKGVASYHGRFQIKDFNNENLQVSDIILASDIQIGEQTNYPINRKEYSILPNPSKRFNESTPLYIYYEIYNLKLGENRLTDFEQEITIRQRDDEGNILDDFLNVLGFDSEGNKISMTSRYQTQEANPQMYLQLDMSGYDPDEYVIEITLHDETSDKTVNTNTMILWE